MAGTFTIVETLGNAESSTAVIWPGGPATVCADGNFSGSVSVAIETALPGSSTWHPVADTAGVALAFTAATDAAQEVRLGAGMQVRATSTSGDGSTDVDVKAVFYTP